MTFISFCAFYAQMEEMTVTGNAQVGVKGLSCLRPTLVLILLVFLGGCTQGCPSSCDCWTRNGTVLCRGRELTAPPEGVPSETRVLDLSRNLITSIRPGEFVNLPELEDLDLSENRISNMDPAALDGLQGLRTLRLRKNRLRTIWPGMFAAMPKLTVLDVCQNPLIILLDETFEALPSLRQLELGEDLVYVAPRAFVGLSGLQHLSLGKTHSSAVPTTALSHLRSLTVLRFRRLNTTTLQDDSFQQLYNLRVLEIERWPRLSTLTPDSLHGLNLTSLSITNCNLPSVPYDSMKHMVYLQFLDLSYNPITVIQGGLLEELVRLRELHLVGGKLSVIEPSAFRGLSRLQVLNISGNGLETLEESAFHSVGSLATLRLDANPLACDCRLLWLVARRARLSFEGREPVCASPESAQGKAFKDFGAILPPGYFTCSRARIPSSTLQLATVGEGETASFQCKAEGVPTPAIEWSTPQQRVMSSGRHGRLRVRSDGSLEIWYAQSQDSGTYQCTASNAGGTDTARAILQVRGFIPNITLDLSTWQPGVNTSHGSVVPLGSVLNEKTLSVVFTIGSLCFLSVVALCFTLLFFWSKVKGPIKRTSEVEVVQHSTGADAQSEAIKYTTKMF
ncbi:leucine-rich repeat and immunoglobulin-like domain-containing nogo receptor-interacting protein 1 [Heterodontus francisci]|uniref:leucine-rich repeat and immunoglobulin-like domain-containing nogo receptor-interacting protein 1 n=1 Tax=Heterodontus francisci TaxID=7792 RepID=UPI00355C18FB